MKNLELFINEVEKNVDADKVVNKDAEKNGTDGAWGIAEPVDDDAADSIDLNSPDNTESMEDLIDKFDAEEDFFIVGKAGWGKTSIITGLAHKYKRKVITVYLDKAEATDLGGIPYVGKNRKGNGVQQTAMPEWASYMQEHDKENFLLFFDEMNQAAPDVMNALMPIVLEHKICGHKFKNFFVGAAGNFESENAAVNELSKPLKSRFKPLITWETNTDKSWTSAFNYMHKKYDDKIGKETIDEIYKCRDCFENPREITDKVLKFVISISGNEDAKKRSKPEKILRRLTALAKEDLSRSEQKQLSLLAEKINDNITNTKNTSRSSKSGNSKDKNMIPENLKDLIKRAMKNGYIAQDEDGKEVLYGISRENINVLVDCFDDGALNAEQMERLISKFEADNVKFRFEKDSEWKKAGYKDPKGE